MYLQKNFQDQIRFISIQTIIQSSMTQCPTCKLSMESHSTSELMECCMKQVGEQFSEEEDGICPNCKHDIAKHSDKELVECTLEFLKSGING